jgi:hypothetical protein
LKGVVKEVGRFNRNLPKGIADSKIYGARRGRREKFSHERRDYITNNTVARDFS